MNSPQAAIQNGSKSFYLASLFFPRKVKTDCWVLYRWCRYCDDRIDDGGTETDLEEIKEQTRAAVWEGEASEPFRSLGALCRDHDIPGKFPMELIEGFERDVQGVKIIDGRDLEKYSYHVAGVVGLMMSHIMGADMPKAAAAAVNMGNAMQLTNIARDIREDYLNGRVYLPQSWLEEAGIRESQLLSPDKREALFQVTRRLLTRADELYQDGYAGLKYLPFRAALAVSIAASIYSSIGRKILRLGPAAIDRRVFVTLPEKLVLVIEGTLRVFKRFYANT